MSRPEPPLDRIDRTLLRLLQNDGRRSYKELGAEVGLAPSSVHGRVQRLQKRGVLQGVHAAVDESALGVSIRAVVFLQLHDHGHATTERFRDGVQAMAEVRSYTEVAGRFDYLLRVAARDTDHLRTVLYDHIAAMDEVRSIETALVFDEYRASVLPDWGET